MTTDIFKERLKRLDKKMKEKKIKIAPTIANFPSHPKIPGLPTQAHRPSPENKGTFRV